MNNFLNWIKLKEEADYCTGFSLSIDVFWDDHKNVDFLTVQGGSVLTKIVNDGIIRGKMNKVDERLTRYDSNPLSGFTYLVVLGQSHLIIHTWPEKFLMNLDIFTCGTEGNPVEIKNFILSKIKPDQVQIKQATRGTRKHTKRGERPDVPNQINTHKPNMQ